MLKIVVFISGRGSNLKAILSHIQDGSLKAEVCAVISDKPEAAGLELAKNAGVPAIVVPRLPKNRSLAEFNAELAATALNYSPDLVVLAGFMRVVTTEFLSAFPGRVVNIHPSLLPSFKGLHAQKQAVEAGVKFAGCTVHYVNEEVDSGGIIAQAVVPVLPNDSEDSLSQRILEKEHKLFPAVLQAFASGQITIGDTGDIQQETNSLVSLNLLVTA
ncbi:MAG: phosphoribosylglycinamide formyltransferase [bacterium]|nr:phosphoribosylglycinamide formyltransferase [bacterium]